MPTITLRSFELWQLLIDFGLFILIWLVQLIIYPSFRYSDPAQFQPWHNAYTGWISLFVVPLMFGQLAIYGFHAFARGTAWDYLALGLVLSVWVVTFAWSVPCHDLLHRQGFDRQVIDRLVLSNWPRTMVWTILIAVPIWQHRLWQILPSQ
jgi:hypothetical protein